MFNTRKLVMATRHKMGIVIVPLLEKGLGVQCVVSKNFDTDVLGTFTGEVELKDDPITTARNKCLMTTPRPKPTRACIFRWRWELHFLSI